MEEIQDLKSARDIQETALKALKEGKVITVRIRGIQYKFKGLRGDEISLEGPGGQEQKASLSKLSEKDIAGFAEAALEPLDADKELRIAVFHIYTGGLREARTRLESLERRNVEIPERMKKRLEILRLGWTYAERDARAAQMLTRMRQAYEAREWDAVNQLLAGLKEYADCGVVAEAKEEIDKIRATAQVAPRRWTPPAPQPPRRDFIKRTDPTTPPPDRLRRE
jgi:hypothetical protein